MEFSFSLLYYLPFLTFFLLFALYIKFNTKPKPSRKTNLPPGSFGWPFIDETYQFLYQMPEKFIGDRMKKYSPKIFKTKVFGEPTVVLCGTAGNKFIATNEEKLLRGWRPYTSQRLFRSSYQKEHSASVSRETEVKIFRAPGFLEPRALMRYLSVMDTAVQQHLETYWLGKANVKAYDLVQVMTATLSCRFYLGLEDQERIYKLAILLNDISLGLHCMPINFPGTIFYRAKKSANAMRKELLMIITEKKLAISAGAPVSDILSHMIVNCDTNGTFMPEHEIADKAMGLLVSGFSTPTSALTCIIKIIGEKPEIYNKIREEQMEISALKDSNEPLNWDDLRKMKYTWNVALEAMRLVPPFQGTFREATMDFTYEGFAIPKGWKIYWAISTTNKDPDHFPEPENFVPTRFGQENFPPPYTNVPFGGGARVCPGKEYARIVILTSLHHMVKMLKWEVMMPNEKMIGSMIPRPALGLPIRLHLRVA